MFFWKSLAFSMITDIGNLISGSFAFLKYSLNIWKFLVQVLLKPDLENFEHYFDCVWDECSLWIFVYLANYLVSFFKPDRSLDPPQDFAKMDPTAEAYSCISILIMGWSPLPFWTPRSLLCMYGRESFPWSQEWAPYLFALAELSFYHYVIGVFGWEQSLNFTPLAKH